MKITETRTCFVNLQPKTKITKNADGFFKEAGAKDELSAERKADQKAVDTAVCFTCTHSKLTKA